MTDKEKLDKVQELIRANFKEVHEDAERFSNLENKTAREKEDLKCYQVVAVFYSSLIEQVSNIVRGEG